MHFTRGLQDKCKHRNRMYLDGDTIGQWYSWCEAAVVKHCSTGSMIGIGVGVVAFIVIAVLSVWIASKRWPQHASRRRPAVNRRKPSCLANSQRHNAEVAFPAKSRTRPVAQNATMYGRTEIAGHATVQLGNTYDSRPTYILYQATFHPVAQPSRHYSDGCLDN